MRSALRSRERPQGRTMFLGAALASRRDVHQFSVRWGRRFRLGLSDLRGANAPEAEADGNRTRHRVWEQVAWGDGNRFARDGPGSAMTSESSLLQLVDLASRSPSGH